jgi:hypothetical protein
MEPACAIGGRRAAVLAGVVWLALGALALATPRPVAAGGAARIRVERESFWYDAGDAPGADGDDDAFVPECVAQLADALDAVLRRYPEQFPQPPPLTIVVRAVSRAQARAAWTRSIGSYGCATLVDGTVVIEVAPSVCVGRDALDDAELRSFLGHELVHAYQYARSGDHRRDPDEIARREIEALEWESAHAEPMVRGWYLDDLQFNLKMYRAMLPE